MIGFAMELAAWMFVGAVGIDDTRVRNLSGPRDSVRYYKMHRTAS